MVRLFTPLWAVLLVLGQAAAADDASPENVLKAKGLKRSGSSYVLPGEAEVQKGIAKARALSQRLSLVAMQKQQFEQGMAAGEAQIREMQQQRVALNQQLSQVTTVDENNRLVGMINALNDQINLLQKQARSGAEDGSQVAGARVAIQREEFMQAVIDVRQTVDKVNQQYEALAKDADVTNALAALNQKGKLKVALGPSRALLANIKLLEKVESSVLTETVDLRREGGVFVVDVTFNGKVTRPMIFDTGASSISLSAKVAEEIGLKPDASAPTVKSRIADGSVVESKLMVIPSVRVGKFTVKDVECTVKPGDSGDVPLLLGGSFLKHFTYKINAEAGKLVLSKVDAPETPAAAKPSARPGRGKRTSR